MSVVKLDHARRVISAAETKAGEIGQHIRMTWNRNRLTKKLGIDYPIIQGPLGGWSSQKLTAVQKRLEMSVAIVERIAILSSRRGITLMVSMMLISTQLLAQPRRKEFVVEHPTFYRTVQVDGLSIFYREAGPRNAPTILLLHGLPSSSRMFEPLFKRLSDRYHLVAQELLPTFLIQLNARG